QNVLTHALDATVQALEYPRMGMAYVNFLIAGRAAADAKVVLSGMGGDELTGGYIVRYAMVQRNSAPPVGRRAGLAQWLRRGRGGSRPVDDLTPGAQRYDPGA